MKDSVSKKILSLNKTYINLDEIEKLVLYSDYDELMEIVNKQIAENVLRPVGKKNTNGMIPPLYLKYRICNQVEDMTPFIEEIRHLHPELKISEYIANPALYKKHRDILLPLSDTLKDNPNSLLQRMSKNERAYSIWKDEKILDKGLTRVVLKYLDMEERLNYYLTPEPFFDYIVRHHENMTVLIIENKDTWFTLRKILTKNPDKCCLHGNVIDALLYGEGNKITKSGSIEEYEGDVLNTKAKFLYFGDLDFTGIYMLQQVCDANPNADIRPLTGLYEDMLTLSDIDKLGQIRKNQKKNARIDEFLALFTEEHAGIIRNILNNNKYIPQEILNYPIFEKLLKKI